MVSLHTLCCGLPALAMLAAALSGAASGISLFAETTKRFHALMHAHEIWILAVSAGLVTVGGVFELSSRRTAPGRGFPWLFAVSVGCFLLNVLIVVAHRGV